MIRIITFFGMPVLLHDLGISRSGLPAGRGREEADDGDCLILRRSALIHFIVERKSGPSLRWIARLSERRRLVEVVAESEECDDKDESDDELECEEDNSVSADEEDWSESDESEERADNEEELLAVEFGAERDGRGVAKD